MAERNLSHQLSFEGQAKKDLEETSVLMEFSARGCVVKYRDEESGEVSEASANRNISVLSHASQVFMDIPMRCMSYTGNDGRNKNLFGLIANDVNTGDVNCYIFRCTSLVRRACRADFELLMLCRLWR